jgi:hypothetical protein
MHLKMHRHVHTKSISAGCEISEETSTKLEGNSFLAVDKEILPLLFISFSIEMS